MHQNGRKFLNVKVVPTLLRRIPSQLSDCLEKMEMEEGNGRETTFHVQLGSLLVVHTPTPAPTKKTMAAD